MEQNENNVQQPVEQQAQQPQQPVYQQPMYQQPVYQQPVYNQQMYPVQKNSQATAGMVLGIISVASVIVGWFIAGIFLYIVAIACGITGIVLSAKGRKSVINKGQATAGLVLSIVGTAIAVIGFTCVACVYGTVGCIAASLY